MVNTWELPTTQKVVAEIAPIFVPYLKELFFNDLGFGTGVLVCDVKSSYRQQSFDDEVEARGDRFHVLIPFGGRFVKWEVIFDWYHPLQSPDFLFSDSFMIKPSRLQIKDPNFLPSWANWDSSDPKSLLKILREFLVKYQEYQVSLLEEDSRTKADYDQLLSKAELAPSAIEVLSGPGDTIRKARSTDKKTVTFLVRLPIIFTDHLGPDLPQPAEAEVEQDPGWVMLFAEFYNPGDTRPRVELRFSPRAHEILQMPNVHALNGMALHAAVAKASLWVRGILSQVGAVRTRRGELLTTLVNKLQPGLVEMDTEHFLSATFAVKQEDFHALLAVELSDENADRKPVVHLRSIYHVDSDGHPRSKALEDFPYSSSWRPEEKADRILAYCFAMLSEFRDECLASAEPATE